MSLLEGKDATRPWVLLASYERSWIHLACHGSQSSVDPTLSSIELYDSPLALHELTGSNFDNAELAFLSACETAQGEEYYPDEAVHVAAGMLAAGFRDVIGTMWTIYDSSAPIIADRVYAEVFKDGKLLVDRIPFALHNAVEYLRNQRPNDFMSWMPFIHLGP